MQSPIDVRILAQPDVITRQLYQEFPELRAELENQGCCLRPENPPTWIMHTSKKAVRVPADVKGMKASAGSYAAQFWLACGAAPVNMGPGDWYTSMEKGLIEGLSLHWAAMKVFGLIPLVKYDTSWGQGGISTATFGQMVSKHSGPLSPNLQKFIMDQEPC